MASLKGPDFITLQVRELETSRHFYADVLGFTLSSETRPNAFAFSAQPISFAIRKSSVDLDSVSQLGYGITLWFRTDDAADLHERLKERGVPIVQGLADSPFGKIFTLRDPDGYLITVHDGG
jgi:predicted enzyme related to lactoylglutathione lyase